MGNNAAFSAFEQSVMAVYKRGKLDKELLSDLMEPYRDVDIDSGGKEGLFVKEDGHVLEVEDVVIKVFTGKFIEPPKLPKDYGTWTPAPRRLKSCTTAGFSANVRVRQGCLRGAS